MSTPNKKEACEQAAKAAIDAIFHSGMTGPRSVDVGFNGDGSIYVANPVSHDEDNPPIVVTQETAPAFARDFSVRRQSMALLWTPPTARVCRLDVSRPGDSHDL